MISSRAINKGRVGGKNRLMEKNKGKNEKCLSNGSNLVEEKSSKIGKCVGIGSGLVQSTNGFQLMIHKVSRLLCGSRYCME